MSQAFIYKGLAFVSFDEGFGPVSLGYQDVEIVQVGMRTYELRSEDQHVARRVVITPSNLPFFQGTIIQQRPGVTTFVCSHFGHRSVSGPLVRN